MRRAVTSLGQGAGTCGTTRLQAPCVIESVPTSTLVMGLMLLGSWLTSLL